MAQNSNILQELHELESTLANMAPQNTYSVPEGYFEELANLVLNRIRAKLPIPSLKNWVIFPRFYPAYPARCHSQFRLVILKILKLQVGNIWKLNLHLLMKNWRVYPRC